MDNQDEKKRYEEFAEITNVAQNIVSILSGEEDAIAVKALEMALIFLRQKDLETKAKAMKEKTLHPLQVRMLELAEKENIQTMSLRELASKVGIKHPNQAKHHLQQLIGKGLI